MMADDPEPVELLGGQCEVGDHDLCPGWWQVAQVIPTIGGMTGRPGRCTCWCHREKEAS
jgi:hypothetical protein